MSDSSRQLLGFAPQVFRARRERVLASLGQSAMVLSAAPMSFKSRDTERRYRADSELFYLTGVVEPEAVAVLRPGGVDGDFHLFVRSRDAEEERWSGERLGPEGAADRYGADAVHSTREMDERLPGLLAGTESVYFRLGAGGGVQTHVIEALETARRQGARKGKGPRGVVDPGALLDPMRAVKDPDELDRMRRAASITVEVYREMLAAARPGAGEWELEAALDGGFRSRGAWGPAYPSIVASGPNACVLHYVANDRTLLDGDLVLVDAGAEVDLYAADITRTFPVSGRFSGAQRAVYDLVLGAHRSAVAAVRPGATVDSIHRAALDELVNGLLDLGILDGSRDEAMAAEAFKRYFPHQTSHWLGLDVHDVGDYERAGESVTLEPGMVLTVEPGLYFPADCDVESSYRGIGVRIEDDVAVTEEGQEVLTAALPVDADDMEALVGGAK